MTTYDQSITDQRCPVVRWNYTDILLAKYPDFFRIHNNECALFSLREIVDNVTIIMDAEKQNAQLWAQVYRTTGWEYRWDIFGKHTWYNVANSLPKLPFTLLDHTNQSTESTIKSYSIKIEPSYGTVYIALGSRISKMFGFTNVGKTQKLIDPTTGIIRRQALNISYNNKEESYISLCQLMGTTYTTTPIAPVPYTHNS